MSPSLIPNFIRENVSLKIMNSWQVGGSAEYLCTPTSLDELKAALKWCLATNLPYQVLGGGTNVLISDRGLRGLTFQLSRLSQIEVKKTENEITFVCLAGTPKADLLKQLLKFKLEPALFIAGIPGSVGGGVAMNAGVGENIEPREFVEIVDWIEVLKLPSFEFKRYEKTELKWSYRHCSGWQEGIISRVGIKLANEVKPTILERVRIANRERGLKQPLNLPNCGSVFRNPQGEKAGRLIETAGLKGHSIGGARVSEKHANFIVNTGKATATDISELIAYIQKEVERRFEVELQTEVVKLGEF